MDQRLEDLRAHLEAGRNVHALCGEILLALANDRLSVRDGLPRLNAWPSLLEEWVDRYQELTRTLSGGGEA